jgi:hypothetical protein
MGGSLTQEQINWLQRTRSLAGAGNAALGGGQVAPGAPSGKAAPPAASQPAIVLPPDGVLPRAGDGALYWQPAGEAAVAQASVKWITNLLEFYWLAPAAPEPAFTFNRAASDMPSLIALVSDQARLAGYVAMDADIEAAAKEILEASRSAQFDAHQIAVSESIMSDEQMDELAAMKMKDMLDALEELRKEQQLDTVARRAKKHRLRLGVLAVLHALGPEWSNLMKAASDEDQEAVRKHVYGQLVDGDATIGQAPPVDPDTDSKSSRALTSAEIAYADKVFRGSIDYSKVKIAKGGISTAGDYARTIGNTIHMPKNAFASGSMELDPDHSDLLVHEMTHVWQYQHHGWTYAPAALWAQLIHGGGAYNWRPAAKKGVSWNDLNPEAQGDAVKDYNAALRAVISGNAGADDYETLKLIAPWQPAFQGGPRK